MSLFQKIGAALVGVAVVGGVVYLVKSGKGSAIAEVVVETVAETVA